MSARHSTMRDLPMDALSASDLLILRQAQQQPCQRLSLCTSLVHWPACWAPRATPGRNAPGQPAAPASQDSAWARVQGQKDEAPGPTGLSGGSTPSPPPRVPRPRFLSVGGTPCRHGCPAPSRPEDFARLPRAAGDREAPSGRPAPAGGGPLPPTPTETIVMSTIDQALTDLELTVRLFQQLAPDQDEILSGAMLVISRDVQKLREAVQEAQRVCG
jgi:hypothetical protein